MPTWSRPTRSPRRRRATRPWCSSSSATRSPTRARWSPTPAAPSGCAPTPRRPASTSTSTRPTSSTSRPRTTGIRIPSRKLLQQHMDAAAEIGAKGLIVHGGHVQDDDDPAKGFDNWRKAVEATDIKIPLLIENTAGGDNAMTRYLERIAGVWDGHRQRRGRRRGRLLPRHLPRPRRRQPARDGRRGRPQDHRPDRPGPLQRQPRRLRLRRRPARQLRRRPDRPRPAGRRRPRRRRAGGLRDARAAPRSTSPTSPGCASGSEASEPGRWSSSARGRSERARQARPARATRRARCASGGLPPEVGRDPSSVESTRSSSSATPSNARPWMSPSACSSTSSTRSRPRFVSRYSFAWCSTEAVPDHAVDHRVHRLVRGHERGQPLPEDVVGDGADRQPGQHLPLSRVEAGILRGPSELVLQQRVQCSHPEAEGLWCGHEGSVPRPIRSTHAEPADHLRRRAPRLPGHPPHRELPPDARLGEGQAGVAVRAPGLGRRQRPHRRRGPGALPPAAPAQALPRLPARGTGHRLVDRPARRLARPAGGATSRARVRSPYGSGRRWSPAAGPPRRSRTASPTPTYAASARCRRSTASAAGARVVAQLHELGWRHQARGGRLRGRTAAVRLPDPAGQPTARLTPRSPSSRG